MSKCAHAANALSGEMERSSYYHVLRPRPVMIHPGFLQRPGLTIVGIETGLERALAGSFSMVTDVHLDELLRPFQVGQMDHCLVDPI
jgi:hypothetical protein